MLKRPKDSLITRKANRGSNFPPLDKRLKQPSITGRNIIETTFNNKLEKAVRRKLELKSVFPPRIADLHI